MNYKEYNKKYYAEHKEELLEKRKKEYNSKKAVAASRKWQKNNKEHWNAYQRAYRAKKKGEKNDS